MRETTIDDARTPLKSGTILRFCNGLCYRITGSPIGAGGGSLIYPAVQVERNSQQQYEDGLLTYALKECYPCWGNVALIRTETGEIVPDTATSTTQQQLYHAQRMQLEEKKITGQIYHSGFRLTPIIYGSDTVELSFDNGASFHGVHNTVTVMESLSNKGISLSQYLKNHRKIPLTHVFYIIEQVLRAVQEVHHAGFLHLDIQDSNLFIKGNMDDESAMISIIDFGSSRKMLENTQIVRIEDDSIFAKQDFASPELQQLSKQTDAVAEIGKEADIYSVGYLLLLLLTGTLYTQAELSCSRTDNKYLTIKKLNRLNCPKHLVDKLQHIIAKALEPDPNHRYHSTEEMLTDILSFSRSLHSRQRSFTNVLYDAYISYDNAPDAIDAKIAAQQLQKHLERFYIPRSLREQPKQRRFQRIFCLSSDMASNDNLEEEIQSVMKHTPDLIVICSAGTAQSERVNRDIRSFLQFHSLSHVYPIWMSGEKEEAIPPELLQTKKHSELFAADIRANTTKELLRRIKQEALFAVAAPMLGTTYDTLKQRWKCFIQKVIVGATTASIAVTCAFVGVGGWALKERQLKLTEYSNTAFSKGDVQSAVQYALDAVSLPIISPSAQSQRALATALGVYDKSDGFRIQGNYTLPSETLATTLSPDGQTAVFLNIDTFSVFDIPSWTELAQLPAYPSALSEVVFLDNHTILYAGKEGITSYDIQNQSVVWTGLPATALCISENHKRVAAVCREDSFATVYDTETGEVISTIDFNGHYQSIPVNDCFANPHDNILELNNDGTLLAVSFADGLLSFYDVNRSCAVYEQSFNKHHFEGGFTGDYFSVSAFGDGTSLFSVFHTNLMQVMLEAEWNGLCHLQASEQGVYFTLDTSNGEDWNTNSLYQLHIEESVVDILVTVNSPISEFTVQNHYILIAEATQYTIFNQVGQPLLYGTPDMSCDFLNLNENSAVIGSFNSAMVQAVSYQSFPDNTVLEYQNDYSHMETRVTHNQQAVTLFSNYGFRTYDVSNKQLADVIFSDSAHFYDKQFIRDEASSKIEVTYGSGDVVSYDALSGEICGQTTILPPDDDKTEIFESDDYRIVSPVHGLSTIYEKKSNKLIGELPKDNYLTYLTQGEGWIVAQYFDGSSGECYGQLLDGQLNIVADLPYLCDVWENTLYFDYPSGIVKSCDIYSLKNLIELAKEQIRARN